MDRFWPGSGTLFSQMWQGLFGPLEMTHETRELTFIMEFQWFLVQTRIITFKVFLN